jgi:hypothetical protein
MKLVSLVAAFLIAGTVSSPVTAQTPIVSQNILTPTVGSWAGTVAGQAGGLDGGGTGPAFNSATNTIIFGYTQGTTTQSISAQTFALQHALNLSNSGIKIQGYNYSWKIDNSGLNAGLLTGKVDLTSGGLVMKTYTYDYSRPTEGFELKTGNETFDTAHTLLTTDSIALSFSGKDSKFWAGYWGPRVREPSLTLNYTTDTCSVNPLSSTTCTGYSAAYLTQQCTGNPLYNSACPGYAEALFTQQCTANVLSNPSCPGYAPAYLAYQCSVNPLYSSTCPGYEQAYLNSQCILDSLYSTKCEGYKTAYTVKYLMPVDSTTSTAINNSLSSTAATKANDPTTVKVATNTATTTVSSDGTVSTGVSTTGDTNVDKAITVKASTTNTTPAAVQLAPSPPAPQQQMSQNEPRGGDNLETKNNNRQDGKRDESAGGPSPQMAQGGQGNESKPAAPTARQAIQERREAAAKAEAVEKGKNLASKMGKASDLEAQKQVQNVVIQAMGFTPGFDAYSKQLIVQQQFYKPYQVYGGQQTVDNRNTLRIFSGTDQLHNDIVASQYNKEK